MTTLPDLFENNRAWARRRREEDPEFFRRLSRGQAPRIHWIGCADSRVPPTEVVGLSPGELFVHRNVANLAPPDDSNGMSALQYAVDALEVGHVVVCGHYGCGGVGAVIHDDPVSGALDRWLEPLRKVRDDGAEELEALPDDEARWRRLCELNVRAQVEAVCRSAVVRDAWRKGRSLAVHGWIYSLTDGLLRDLELTVEDEA